MIYEFDLIIDRLYFHAPTELVVYCNVRIFFGNLTTIESPLALHEAKHADLNTNSQMTLHPTKQNLFLCPYGIA